MGFLWNLFGKKQKIRFILVGLVVITMLAGCIQEGPKSEMDAWQACQSAKGDPTGKKFSHYIVGVFNSDMEGTSFYQGLQVGDIRNAGFDGIDIDYAVPGSVDYPQHSVDAVVCLQVTYFIDNVCHYTGADAYMVSTEADIVLIAWPSGEVIARQHGQSSHDNGPCASSIAKPFGDKVFYWTPLQVDGLNFGEWLKQYKSGG